MMQQKADTRLEAKLDSNEYDESQLIEIKVPLSMPYQTDWAGFERCDGEIEVNGIHYKYVKRKVQNGSLILKCIINDTKQRLEAAKEDIFTSGTDMQQGNAAKKPGLPTTKLFRNLSGDYDDLHQLNIAACGALLLSTSFNRALTGMLPNFPIAVPDQPPRG